MIFTAFLNIKKFWVSPLILFIPVFMARDQSEKT
jgi:hypothetical protein